MMRVRSAPGPERASRFDQRRIARGPKRTAPYALVVRKNSRTKTDRGTPLGTRPEPAAKSPVPASAAKLTRSASDMPASRNDQRSSEAVRLQSTRQPATSSAARGSAAR
jgi:hypothetical protein